MALMISKSTPTDGPFTGNTPNFDPANVYIIEADVSYHPTWIDDGYDILLSIPNVAYKYLKNSGTAIVEMSVAEKAVIDDAQDLVDGYDKFERGIRNRIDYKKTFQAATARQLMKDLGYSIAQVEFVFITISGVLNQMNNATLIEARATLAGVIPASDPVDDFTTQIQTKMLADIDAYLAAE